MATQASSFTLKQPFLIPTYYLDFRCKGPECRNTCCSGWGVTVSMQQYFNLLGLACDKPLRDKIDRTFRPLLQPSNERFAEIAHNHLGNCPLQMENGYCMLHNQCGEKSLPWVCRNYPRGPRAQYAYETSCSNSCEKTLELMFANDRPMSFTMRELQIELPNKPQIVSETQKSEYQRIRSYCFAILQNRSDSLPTRLLKIGKVLAVLDNNKQADLMSMDLTVPKYEKNIPYSYQLLLNFSRVFGDHHSSISEYCEENAHYYKEGGLDIKYQSALLHFESVLPNHEILFEKMLMNHLFFSQFPFSGSFKTLNDEFIGLCGTYVFLRFISISLMRLSKGVQDFIDIMAKTFRVIAHSSFDKTITSMLKNENAHSFDTLGILLQA